MKAKLRRAVLVGMTTTLGVAIWPAVSLASQAPDPVAPRHETVMSAPGHEAMMSAPGHDKAMGTRGHEPMMSAPGHDRMMQDRR